MKKITRAAIRKRLALHGFAHVSGHMPADRAREVQAEIDTHLPDVEAIKDKPRERAKNNFNRRNFVVDTD